MTGGPIRHIPRSESCFWRLNSFPAAAHFWPGADPAAVAFDGMARAKSRNVDRAIVDTAGRRPLRELRHALTPKGTLVVVGGDGGGPWTGGFFRGMLRGPIVSMFAGQRLGAINAKTTKEDLQALSELIEAGSVTPVVDRTFDLVEAADAVRYLAEGHAAGKIVVTV